MQKIFTILGLIGIGIAGRLLPHAPNATPITAITLTARRQLGPVWAFILPLVAMLISDAIIGFYDWKILISVYASFALIGCMSVFMRKGSGAGNTILYAIIASLIFFLITNFTVWLFSPWYEKSLSGLIYCFTLGFPFLRNMALGDIAYTFGLLTLSEVQVLARCRQFIVWSFGTPRPTIAATISLKK